MRNARRSRKGTLYSADKGFAAGWSQQSCKAGKNAGSAYGRAYHRNRKANMWCFGGLLKRLIPALNAQAGAMLGTTCTFKNLQPTQTGDCTAEVFFRCVKEEDLQSDLEVFRKIAAEYEIEIEEILEDEYHRPASLTSEGYRFIKSCVEEQFNYAACAPFILPAGTDARHFSDLSDVVIRFAPIDINSQQYASVHNGNENIGMDAVARAVEFYKNLLKKM